MPAAASSFRFDSTNIPLIEPTSSGRSATSLSINESGPRCGIAPPQTFFGGRKYERSFGFYTAPVWRNRDAVHFPDRRDTSGPCEAPHHCSIKVEEAPSEYSCANRDIVASQHAESDSPAARYTCANSDADACGHSDP